MKLLILSLIFAAAPSAFAQDYCDFVMYQPGAESMPEAADHFAIETMNFACELKKKVRVKESQYLRITSFDIRSQTFQYEVDDFTVEPMITWSCSIEKKGGKWSEPECDVPVSTAGAK